MIYWRYHRPYFYLLIKKIFYQGSEGSYSESVLEACFQETEYVAWETFKETLGNVSSEDFALLPVENSLVGTVIEAYENLTESNLEVYLEIRKKIVIKNYLKDHRIMALCTIAALTLGGTWKIFDPKSIQTSFPSFFKILKENFKVKII